MMKSQYRSVNDLLLRQAQAAPERLAFTFLKDGEADEINWTYGELDQRARAVAAELQSAGAAGARALLLYPPGLDFVAAFFGCLYAGAIAVPAYPPRLNRNLLRLHTIVKDCDAAYVMTTRQTLQRIQPLIKDEPQFQSLCWVVTDDVPLALASAWQNREVSGESTAFLQYTSGSTASPKGVVVSHSNLLHNEFAIQQAFRQSESSIIVGWLPLYHDMGLIGNMLQPVYTGAHCILMSPAAFLQCPSRWLRAISRYRGTTSGGPNFSYDLCTRKITEEEETGLDLSSWTVAFNGAEPVRPDTMERFVARFGRVGFSAKAFAPCYGLAESTLLVTADAGETLPRTLAVNVDELAQHRVAEANNSENAKQIAGCGRESASTRVVIVDPESLTLCAPHHVGEIWISGPCVAGGYWNNKTESDRVFRARIDGSSEGPFLRTGDLGFLREGELFVTGRSKDMVIIRGRNYYPQDIELTVESSHSGLRQGCGAAFAIEAGGQEHLVIVQEVEHGCEEKAPEAVDAICTALAEQHEIQPHAVVLIQFGSIPKTSSGKIQRYACREQFLKRKLTALLEWRAEGGSAEPSAPESAAHPPATPLELGLWLAKQIAGITGVNASAIQPDHSMTRYAVDSLAAISLAHTIEKQLGVTISLPDVLGKSMREFVLGLWNSLQSKTQSSTSSKKEGAGEHLREFPLSEGQRALWFLHQLAPESTAYNLSFAARIQSEVDAEMLKKAFQLLLQRHPLLRTTFHAVEGEPFQRGHDFEELSLVETDAADWDEATLKRALEREAAAPFHLESGPLLRVVLFRHAPGRYSISLTVHHIIADLWSIALLMHELTLIYQAKATLQEPALPAPAGTYLDFVNEQRRMLLGEEGSRLLSYWRHQLGGELPALELPSDRPRPPLQTFHGASKYFRLNTELRDQIRKLSQDSGTTIYMTLLSAFQVLLGRYSGQQEILVGSPMAGRSRAQWVNVFGYFVNPVVLRAQLAGRPAFAEFMRQTRTTVLQALESQTYPFTRLVEHLQPQRDPSRSPLFQAMFAFEKTLFGEEQGLSALAAGETGKRIELNGLTMEPVRTENQTALFDLMLSMADSGDSLCGSFQYNTDLFDAATIERLARHWEHLLHGIVVAPQLPVQELPLLTSAEQEQLLLDWNRTEQPWPWDGGIHELFARQAQRDPSATAVSFRGKTMSYAELDQRTNQLARYLGRLGVGPEVRVGICVERTLEMVIGLLGILKAGGAYVPLDPAYPAERQSYMLADAEAPVLLTQRSLAERMPAYEGIVIKLDEDGAGIGGESCSYLDSKVDPENLAYVIYTSGSTGKPKGVAIRHGSAATLVRWAQTVFSPEDLSGVLASTSICFDLSVFEIFVPLSCGGSVLIAANALELPSLHERERVTLVNTVPSAIRELAQMDGVPESVRTVNLAGEPLGAALVHKIYEKQHIDRVLNLYGPSEDTTYSTCACLADGVQEVSIGRPIAKTQLYVLAEGMEPVPLRVAGELYIGGVGLARGYLKRPDLTAEKFVPNPFSTTSGERLYRTGDRVRYRDNGELEFLGRVDYQVKVRGFRIELGEIESVLLECEGVEQAIVIAREDRPGEKSLAAYVAGKNPGRALSVDGLRQHLRQRLPEYMVPAAFVQLERMPLTPNGKVDRKALPVPAIECGRKSHAPFTPVEEMIAAVWTDLLGAAPGRDDNFFELGGHSLLAGQVVARLRSSFGIELPLKTIFEAPTLAALAQKVELTRRADVAALPPFERRPQQELPPLSWAQRRLWFLDQLAPGGTAYNLPGAVKIHGALDVPALKKSVAEIARRHESLRTRFVVVDGEPRQVIDDQAAPSFEVKDLGALPPEVRIAETERIAREEARMPFRLESGPLLRVKLLQLGADDYALLLTIHHIVSDGWSLGVLISELSVLYEAFRAGEASPLPELAIQYADYALWQQKWLSGGALDREVTYWKKQLAGLPPVLDLPVDHPRLPVASNQGATAAFMLDSALVARLKSLGRSHGATLYMTLLAAFQTLLYRRCGQEDFSVGAPIAGRTHTETEAMIGLFVNTLVLRASFAADPDFIEVLQRAKKATLDAYTNQHVPLANLVEILQPERSLGRNPLFQVTFDLQTAALPQLKLGDAQVEPYKIETSAAKFDLSMTLRETGGDVAGELEYDTALFDASTIDRIVESFKVLLAGIAERPEQSVHQLPLLTQAESKRLLVHWNSTKVDYPRYPLVTRLIEQQAERAPGAVAVACAGRVLSYRELNDRANQLARWLVSAGVGTESRVGICMERSPEMLVALLAALKAGAAYVPLDPELPPERLSYMAINAGTHVVLTGDAGSPLPPDHDALVMNMNKHWERIACESTANFSVTIYPEQLAYLIYTSGSTGKPKAVAITHSGLINLIHWHNECYQVGPEDRMTQFAALSFDAAVWEIWPALVAGSQLHIVENEVRRDPERLPQWLLENKITISFLPTPVAEATFKLEWPERTTLRYLLTGGDKLQHFPGQLPFILKNHYGPTENTVVATGCMVTEAGESAEASPSIGFPIANTQVYVLNKHGELSPSGVAGELYIGGAGMARGYLNDPALTAEKFVPNPYSGTGDRLYRTGDQVRWRADGKLEFLGRIDHQVKIRGYRIELGDIEAALAEHPNVRQLAVTVWEPRSGDKQLAAYVVPNGKDFSGDELRRYLKARLPEYMVPASMLVLEQLPLTHNGKVDRAALPVPQITGEKNYVAPRSPTEEALCKIWSDVLEVERVGIEDDFFELGGHSLLATRVVSRVRTQMEVDLPLLNLFRATRIGDLSPLVDEALSQRRAARKPRLTRLDRNSYLAK